METMRHICFFALLVVSFAPLASAQTPEKKETQPVAPKAVDPELAERRTAALSLLESLAISARSYRDEALRARVQARVADVLWDYDKENARSLFRRAWEVAETLESRPMQSSIPVAGRRRNPPTRQPTRLRSEILGLAARRDRTLGEEFLARMSASQKDETSAETPRKTEGISDQQAAERLRLARDFLRSGDVERGIQFADPALVAVTREAIQFLVELRSRDAAAADKRFGALLVSVANDAEADANTVSLLTTYAFTPTTYLIVSPGGIPSSMSSDPLPAPDLDPALRAAYFRVAANILLRPFAQIDRSSAGRAGTHLIITRVLPLFQQYVPDSAAALKAQLAAMGPEAAAATARNTDVLNRGIKPPDPSDDLGVDLEDRLKDAQTADARDRLYAMAAMRASDIGDARAREWIDKIEDPDTRNGLRSFVDYNFILSLIRKRQIEEALALIRKVNLSPILRAHLLIQASAVLPRTEVVRINELLEESLTATRRIDPSAPERAYNLIAILAQFVRFNKVRTWELLSEAIKGANAIPDFDGERGGTSVTLEGKFGVTLRAELISPSDLNEIFRTLAENDFYQAVNSAHSFSGEAPRALTTMSIASAILRDPRGKSKSAAQ